MSRERIDCLWCGKKNRTASEWEQERLRYPGVYSTLCTRCANRRLNNPYSGCLPMRKRTPEPVSSEAASPSRERAS